MSCTVPIIRSGRPCASRRMFACSCTQRTVPSAARRDARCRTGRRWPRRRGSPRAPRRDRRGGRTRKTPRTCPRTVPSGTPKMRCDSADQPSRSDPSSSATQLPMCATSCACSRNVRWCSSASAVRTDGADVAEARRPCRQCASRSRCGATIALEDAPVLEAQDVEPLGRRIAQSSRDASASRSSSSSSPLSRSSDDARGRRGRARPAVKPNISR